MENNLFSDKFEKLYDGGSGLGNFKASNNTTVKSVEFVSLDGNDFHLTSASRAIDIGSLGIGQYAQIDKDGKQRNQGGGVDLGAYEYSSPR